MRLGQTSIVFFVSRVLGSAIGFFATIYFARVLGAEILGFYALVLSIVTWLTVVGSVGFSGAITKRISEGSEREAYATAGAITMGAIGSVVVIGIVVFGDYVNAYVGRPVSLYTAAIVLATFSTSFVYAALKGYHLVHVYAILSTTKFGVRSLIQIALVLVGFQLTALLAGYAAAAVIFSLLGLAVLRIRPAVPKKEHFVSLLDYAKFSWLGGLQSRTFDQMDIIVLGFFVQAGLIGIYSIAWSIGKFLDIFGTAISTTLFPEMSETAAKNDPTAVSGLAEDGLAYAGLILIPGLVGSLVVGDRLMAIYSEEFVAGTDVLAILIGGLLVYTYTKQLINTLNAVDRPDLAFRVNGAFVVANLALNVVLVWQIGWVGAAIATALSAAVGLVVSLYYTSKVVPLAIPRAEIARQWVAAVAMGALVHGIRQIGETHPISTYNEVFLVLLVGLGAGVYLVVLLAISPRFRTTVDRNLPVDLPSIRS